MNEMCVCEREREREREGAHKKDLQNKDADLGFPAIHSLTAIPLETNNKATVWIRKRETKKQSWAYRLFFSWRKQKEAKAVCGKIIGTTCKFKGGKKTEGEIVYPKEGC